MFSLKCPPTMSPFSFFTLIFFCFSCLIDHSHALKNSLSVELIHRDSFKSPLYRPTETKFQKLFNAMHRSINRANYLNQKFSPTKNKFVSSLTGEFGGEYLMSYSVGTPPFKVYGLMDTGSNLVWLQCQPCKICYNQTYPIFNPSNSSSYKKIPCSSRMCKSMEANISCSYNHNGEDACEYTYNYGDDTTQGDLSVETITLDSTSGSIVSFSNIMIGCGHTNIMGYNVSTQNSGIIGLASGPLSLIKQLGSSIGEKFSYCLIGDDQSKNHNVSSKLNFGDDVSGDNVVSTPMAKIIGRFKDFYFLTLEAFSVGDKRIKYGGFKYEGTNASTQNILIDSGTTLTILPQNFYTKLESAVVEMVKIDRFHGYSTGLYNLCYNITTTKSKRPNFPVITAHFSGADVKLYSNVTFVPFDDEIQCFGFIPSDGIGLFGNLVQQNYLVGYDLKKNIVSFKPTDCTKYY